MRALLARFPEVSRYVMSETRHGRLSVAAVVVAVLGAAFLMTESSGRGKDGSVLYVMALGMQAAVLLVYGSIRAATSVTTERMERTWDVQRLTPQSAAELGLGKLIGAPVFAFVLAGFLVPWVVAGFLMSPEVRLGHMLWQEAVLLCITFLTLSLSLLASACTEDAGAGASAGTAGAILGVVALQVALPVMFALQDEKLSGPLSGLPSAAGGGIPYMGLSWPAGPWVCASALAFGAWALTGAVWRIGRDLLESGRPWKLPAFMVFLLLYQCGFKEVDPFVAMVAPAFIAYCAALVGSERRDHWRRWFGPHAVRGWLVPSWIIAAASYSALALAATAVGLGAGFGAKNSMWRYPLVQACFLVRDCVLLQGCRFTKSRRPEVMAMILLCVAYVLPPLVLRSLDAKHLFFLFAPVVDPDVGALANLALPALEAVAALFALDFFGREAFRGSGSP